VDGETGDLFKQIHQLRNRLNHAGMSGCLAKKLLEAGRAGDALQTIQALLDVVRSEAPTADSLPASKGHNRLARPRTLLVEDNPNERQLMAGLLRASGFDVEVAGDGAEALGHLASDFRPDVVLMDMLMPTCDGPTAVRRIRSTPAWEGIKIYAISGSTQSEIGLETGPRGVDRWYSKPLDPDNLVDELTRELLAGRSPT
jgi:CheY-like chemotaxis protein